MSKITSRDVARAAGVSQSTVSRALAGDERISSDTRERILSTAQSIGYTPNELARSLLSNKSNIVGLVMGDLLNPFYPTVLNGFVAALQKRGKRVLLFTVPPGGEVDDVLPFLLQYQVEGVIITSSALSSKMANACERNKTPVVLFNRATYKEAVCSVCCANVQASFDLTERLIEAEHDRFAIIGGRADTSTHIERKQGLEEALARHGLALVGDEMGDNTYEGGFAAALRLLRFRKRPNAIVCVSDVMAMGALDAARFELGLRVPQDLSIVGFDDIPSASWPSYQLTTVRQPIDAMIERSLALLFDPERKTKRKAVTERLPGELIVRASALIAAKHPAE